jgi:hypothetical protein
MHKKSKDATPVVRRDAEAPTPTPEPALQEPPVHLQQQGQGLAMPPKQSHMEFFARKYSKVMLHK